MILNIHVNPKFYHQKTHTPFAWREVKILMLVRMLRLARLARAVRLMVPLAAQQIFVPNEIWATCELNRKKYHFHCLFLGRAANYSSFHPKLHRFVASSAGLVSQILAPWLPSCHWNEIWHLCFQSYFPDPRFSLVRTWVFPGAV